VGGPQLSEDFVMSLHSPRQGIVVCLDDTITYEEGVVTTMDDTRMATVQTEGYNTWCREMA
jgi:hypothetical protein